MGRISSINTGFWTSPQVVDNFTPEERYVYLYCLTNPRTNLCGCYEVSIKTIAFETGMERYEVRDILDRLQHRHGVICYDADTRELFIINWLRNHWNSSPRWQKTRSAVSGRSRVGGCGCWQGHSSSECRKWTELQKKKECGCTSALPSGRKRTDPPQSHCKNIIFWRRGGVKG